MDSKLEARRRASIYAVDLIEGCTSCSIAMGSGSTVKLFIEELSRSCLLYTSDAADE